MTQYNSLNVKLSNSQLNNLKSAIKNENDVVLRLSSNMVGNSNDNNFPHFLLILIKKSNDKDHKFKVDDRVRISKYKNIFAKGYNSNWSEEVCSLDLCY